MVDLASTSAASRRLGRSLGVVVLSTAGAFLVREVAGPQFGFRFPFLPYVCAVLLSAWSGGRWFGLLATAASASLAWAALPPGGGDRLQFFGTLGFLVVGTVASLLADHLLSLVERERRAHARLAQVQQERERAESATLQRRAELDALMQAVPALVMVAHDREARRITGNALATAVLGVARDANLAELTKTPDDAEATASPSAGPVFDSRALREAALRGVAVTNSEMTLTTAEGRVLTLFGSAVPWTDALGRVTGAVGAYVDITVRRRAQETLLAAERRFRALIDKSADLIVTCDGTGRFAFASPSVRGLTGYSIEEFLALPPDQFWHPADLPAWHGLVAALRDTPGASATLETRFRRHDGQWRWFEGTYTSLFHDAAVGSLVGNLRDVTARKRTEADTALLAAFASEISEHRDEHALLSTTCRRLATHLDVPYCAVVDSTVPSSADQITRWDSWPADSANHVGAVLETLARHTNAREAAGRTLVVRDAYADSLLAPGDCAACRDAGVRALLVVPLQVHEDRGASLLVAAHEPRDWTQDDVRVVENLATRAWYAVQQGRLLQQQLEARRAAESASVLKDEFVAVVSHELRTPLNAILGWAQVGMVDPAQRDRALETIARNARRQARLVDDLLDLARMVSGHDQLTMVPLDLAEVVRTAVEALTPAAQEKGVALQPVDVSPAAVVGDTTRLQQVVWNLLSNAVKFTPAGGTVRIETRAIGGDAVLRVRDTGEGIDPEFLPHVFERFRQAEPSSARKRGGLGLGLSITRHLVEAHRGHVEARSEGRGRGAEFTVRLPLASGPVRRTPRTRTDVEAFAPCALQGVRVLVVDDEADTRHYVEVALKQHGADVYIAESSRAALEYLANGTLPHVILADIAMPDEDGIALIKAVRKLPGARGRVPAAAFTAFAGENDRRRAIAAGFHVHLSKPLDVPAIVKTVIRLSGRGAEPPESEPARAAASDS